MSQKEPTNEQKIVALERIVRAIFGRPEGEIKYKYFDLKMGLSPQISIECDIDDAVKVKSMLENQEIMMEFFADGIMRDAYQWEKDNGAPDKVPEAVVFADLFLETQYWKENESLKKEVDALKTELEKTKEVKPNES